MGVESGGGGGGVDASTQLLCQWGRLPINLNSLHFWARTYFGPHRSSVGRTSDSQPASGSSPGSRRFGARYIEPPDGDDLRSGQRPQPVEVGERGGSCPPMWTVGTLNFRF